MAYKLAQPIFIVGFMGAGKTSVARKLARRCGLGSIDLDNYLQRMDGRTIAQIFAEAGEEGFRRIELEALQAVLALDDQIVSCGGGIVETPACREILKNEGYTVYLHIDAYEAKERISNFSARPLFKDVDGAEEVRQRRVPYYEDVAQLEVRSGGRSIQRLASIMQAELEKAGVLVREEPEDGCADGAQEGEAK